MCEANDRGRKALNDTMICACVNGWIWRQTDQDIHNVQHNGVNITALQQTSTHKQRNDTMEMQALGESAHQESVSKSGHKLPQNGSTCHITKVIGKQTNKENNHDDITKKIDWKSIWVLIDWLIDWLTHWILIDIRLIDWLIAIIDWLKVDLFKVACLFDELKVAWLIDRLNCSCTPDWFIDWLKLNWMNHCCLLGYYFRKLVRKSEPKLIKFEWSSFSYHLCMNWMTFGSFGWWIVQKWSCGQINIWAGK